MVIKVNLSGIKIIIVRSTFSRFRDKVFANQIYIFLSILTIMKGPSLLRIPSSFSTKVPLQTFNKIVRIRDLLGRAIDEVHTNKKRDS